MEKAQIRINESTLRKIVAESVKKVLSEGVEEGFGDRLSGAAQGFRQGRQQMQQTDNAAFVGGVANNYLQSIKQAIQYLQQGNSSAALETLKMVYNNIGSASNNAGMQQKWGHKYSEMQ